MPTKTGTLAAGSSGSSQFATPRSIGITMGTSESPKKITFTTIKSKGADWHDSYTANQPHIMDLYLCDSQGNNAIKLFTISLKSGSTVQYTPYEANISYPNALAGKALYVKGVRASGGTDTSVRQIWLRHNTGVEVETYIDNFSITTRAGTGGTLTSNMASASPGTTVTLTIGTETGYHLESITSSDVTLSGSGNTRTFVMPSKEVTVTASFAKTIYTVTTSAGDGGTLTANYTQTTYGTTVTLTAAANPGYSFSGFSSSQVTITRNGNTGTFTMPAGNVAVSASFTRNTYSISAAASPAAGGSVSLSRSTGGIGDSVTVTATAAAGYSFSGFTCGQATITRNGNTGTFTMPAGNVAVTAIFTKNTYSITGYTSPAEGGSISLSRSTATIGDVVTVTAYEATGWQLSSITSSDVTLSGSGNSRSFTMPAGNVSVTATFTKRVYSISGSVSPAGAGTMSFSKTSATMGETITVTVTAGDGYHLNGISSGQVTLSGSGNSRTFTMPAGNVAASASFLRRSTATLSKSSMTGGETVTLTISTENTGYTHKYTLSFGSGMSTGEVAVGAGVTTVAISIPRDWSQQIPNQTSKTGGTLTLTTYSDGTQISSAYTISGLTYNVPADAVPTFAAAPAASILRTVGGRTYADVGAYYVQNHCGVRVTAAGAGVLASTITAMSVAIAGYSGAGYSTSQSGGSLDFSSGLLTLTGETVITVTITDSRGRRAQQSIRITVEAYNAPSGILSVYRVDGSGNEDNSGEYGVYEYSRNYTQIGTNSLTVTLTCRGVSAVNPALAGNLMPGDRLTFELTKEYEVTLTLADAFESLTISRKLPSARFIMHITQDGDHLAVMKAANKQAPAGKEYTFEIAEECEVFIGDDTLKQYIQKVINGTI